MNGRRKCSLAFLRPDARMTGMTVESLDALLRSRLRGEVYTDRLTRGLYATDASPYQIDPVAVVVPRDDDDVRAILRVAHEQRVPILPRGGGTSLAGQTVGRAIQVDFSKHLNAILEVNAAERWVRVQPGIVLDHLNAALVDYGLRFAPDVAPSNRATIGGMIANNSSGAYSLHYGKTIDHVLELRVLLSDGTETTLREMAPEEWAARCSRPGVEGACYSVVSRLADEQREEIARRYPRIMRRVGGYNLDAFAGSGPRNLTRMIVGSEGTLAVILEAKLRLVPRPPASGVVLLEFADLFDALDAVVPCLECSPVAVELLDDLLLDLTRKSLKFKEHLAILKTKAAAVLLVEFFGKSRTEVVDQLDGLIEHLGPRANVVAVTSASTAAEAAPIWLVRRAGLPLLQSMSAGLKPETCVEDSAVPPEHLSAYIRRFKALVEQQGTIAAFYGHASVGLLHVRPLLNLHDPADIRKLRALSEGIRDLALEYGGAVSGEHGDGLLRSEHNERVFGPRLYQAFRDLKRTFDPDGLLNPGKIVDAPRLDENLRYVPPRGTPVALRAHFAFRDTGGMLGAAELCNGNGACRKTDGGTMCPSYMVTRDEEHSTRGRANALRLALGGALSEGDLWSERMHAVLDLCIECKGCTAERPSRVNMTRLKSEWLAQYYGRRGTPLRAWVFGNIRTLNRLGSLTAPLSNWAVRMPGAGLVAERLLGVSRHRPLPRFARTSFARWFERHRKLGGVAARGSVVLFPDTFTLYNEPRIGITATRLLERLGYEVILPERRVCCGRPMISKGLLDDARRLGRAQLQALAPYVDAGLSIVGLEPSCLLTFRDEYPDLLDEPRCEALRSQSMLLDEFLNGELRRGVLQADDLRGKSLLTRPALLHGHCHQKALASTSATLSLLRAAGLDAREVDSGCCGMAGSFGYEREHYDISLKIGERALLPAVRAAPGDAIIVAMGTSCRQQIGHGTGRTAYHLAEVLWSRMEPA